jgi:hypothetical protein
MKPNERAQHNHNELFPGHVSTLAVTDREMAPLFVSNDLVVGRLKKRLESVAWFPGPFILDPQSYRFRQRLHQEELVAAESETEIG